MTRPVLVLDGTEVKLRLQADRSKASGAVHVDWLRFTCKLKNAPWPTAEVLFPPASESVPAGYDHMYDLDVIRERRARVIALLRGLPDPDFAASAQAHAVAQKICKILGPEFDIEPELKKGHDFYRFRWSIVRNGAECAWVGFLASGDSPRQQAQAQTIHANIYGSACTFARGDWRLRMADLCENVDAKITRCDLALDFFEGISGGLTRVHADWHAGLMNVAGRTPKPNTVGPWVEGGRGRSFYFGSKEAGKQTNVYEKGVQLFGEKDATNWERIELRYGDKLRVLPADILRRPDDFFAGASDWHAAMLAEHGQTAFAESIKVRTKQAVETVKAEVTRSVRWLTDTASQSLALAFRFLGEDEFTELVRGREKPGRLQRFDDEEIRVAFASLSPTIYQPKAQFGALAH